MIKNVFYLKFDDARLNLLDDGIDVDCNQIKLTFVDEGYSVDILESLFSNLTEGLTIYSCILQEDGTETDEFIGGYYNQYTLLDSIINNENGTYTIKLKEYE